MMNDTIYREDAIEVVSLSCGPCLARNSDDCEKCSVPKLRELINAIPSTDRPQGEWIIEIDVNGNTYGRCSICGMRQYAGQLNFCPDCEARMKGADDE